MPEVDAGGVRLHYVERAGPGEPIIFVHGHHGTHHAWDGVIQALPSAHHALAADLRGSGLPMERPAELAALIDEFMAGEPELAAGGGDPLDAR